MKKKILNLLTIFLVDQIYMQLHILTKRILNLGVTLGFYLPIWMIDKVVLLLCYLVFGDTSKHGLRRPAIGPFAWKQQTSTLPVIDVGTYKKIKSGEIQVSDLMKLFDLIASTLSDRWC
jgi:hypothetical protein